MPSFSRATKVKELYRRHDGVTVFEGEVDLEWSVLGKPHGGYLLSVVIHAVSMLQKESKPFHPHPANLTSSFLRGANKGPIEIHTLVQRTGKTWTNIEVKVWQKGEVLIHCLALYTLFPPLAEYPPKPFSDSNQTLLPLTPGDYTRITPFITHPSAAITTPQSSEANRRWSSESASWFVPSGIKWAEDLGIKARREGTDGIKRDRLELEWGAWCEFARPDDEVDGDSLPFFVDLMSSIPEVFPEGQRVTPHYYPTLSMTIQWHTALPLEASTGYLTAPSTVGCFSTGTFINNGIHEQRTEVWSAPAAIGQHGKEAEPSEQWRKRSMILVTATQIAVTTGMAKAKMSENKRSAHL